MDRDLVLSLLLQDPEPLECRLEREYERERRLSRPPCPRLPRRERDEEREDERDEEREEELERLEDDRRLLDKDKLFLITIQAQHLTYIFKIRTYLVTFSSHSSHCFLINKIFTAISNM